MFGNFMMCYMNEQQHDRFSNWTMILICAVLVSAVGFQVFNHYQAYKNIPIYKEYIEAKLNDLLIEIPPSSRDLVRTRFLLCFSSPNINNNVITKHWRSGDVFPVFGECLQEIYRAADSDKELKSLISLYRPFDELYGNQKYF